MFNFLRDLYYKICRWLYYKTHNTQITVRGLYFYKYLKKIIKKDFKEEDYIQAYEDAIKDFQELNNLSTREEAVFYYFLLLNEALKESREKYGEEPMSF